MRLIIIMADAAWRKEVAEAVVALGGIGAVGKYELDERKAAVRRLEQGDGSVAVLYAGRVDEKFQNPAVGVDHGVALAARRQERQHENHGHGFRQQSYRHSWVLMPHLARIHECSTWFAKADSNVVMMPSSP